MLFGLQLVFTGCSKDEKVTGPPSGGVLYQVGDIMIPVLSGSNLEMGKQLGELMRGRIREFYHAAVEDRINERIGLSFSYMVARANELWDTVIPPGIKALCDGLAITSGLTLDQLKVLQTIDIILMKRSGCSAIMLWDDYSDGGVLLFGHNTDNQDALSYMNLICITVFKPSGMEHQFAVFGFPGAFSITAGVNDAGLTVAQNSAPMSTVFAEPDFYIPCHSLKSFSWLGSFSTLEELRAAYLESSVSVGCNYLAADAFSGACFETAVDIVLERAVDAAGLICETNHFVHFYLQGHNNAYYGGAVFTSSHNRLQNLRDRAAEFKGEFTSRRLIGNVLSVPEVHGGVSTGHTVSSFVIRPVDLQLLIRSPSTFEPLEIDLTKYFD